MKANKFLTWCRYSIFGNPLLLVTFGMFLSTKLFEICVGPEHYRTHPYQIVGSVVIGGLLLPLVVGMISLSKVIKTKRAKRKLLDQWTHLVGSVLPPENIDIVLRHYARCIQSTTDFAEARHWKEAFTQAHDMACKLGETPLFATVREYQTITTRHRSAA